MTVARSTTIASVTALVVLLLGGTGVTAPAGASAQEHGRVGSTRFRLIDATVPELQQAMASGAVTSVGLVDAYLARIDAYDQAGPRLNAILHINPKARQQAADLDRERANQGSRGPLHGIPIILKDNYDTADMPTSAGSVALAGFVPPRDAFQVRKLRQAGAVILAKANMEELAMGITTISSLGGQTRNPYDPRRNPGGSSGGTGAAVAAGFAAFGMGSDTCGSIRIPASHNNLVGLRPTKGLSSISGIVPLSHTQDVGGPLTRSVTDLAMALDATIGADPDDPATAALESRELPSFEAGLTGAAIAGTRFGRLTALIERDVAESSVIDAIDAALEKLEEQGAEIIDIEVPGMMDLIEKSGLIRHEFKFDFIDYLSARPGAPISSLTEMLDGGLHHQAMTSRFENIDEVEQRDSADYRAALKWREILRDTVVQVLDEHTLDAIAYPTIVQRPKHVGERQPGSNCALSAQSGLPAISVPAGFTSDGLPVGLELLGRPFDDVRLVALAFAFEQSTGHRVSPAVTPDLINGKAPGPLSFEVSVAGKTSATDRPSVVRGANFTLDPTRNRLRYTLTIEEGALADVLAVTLHIGDGADAPVIGRLAGPGARTPVGELELRPADRAALDKGEISLRVFTRDDPRGERQGRLILPR